MQHTISILLQNEAGALSRVAGLFSSRGYNIETLHVAPTHDHTVSRLTLVTKGSDEVIHQICNQLLKLVDVVNLVDMTLGDHVERELLLLKLQLSQAGTASIKELLDEAGALVLDDRPECLTVEVTGTSPELEAFLDKVGGLGEILTVVRSGTLAIARGTRSLEHDFA